MDVISKIKEAVGSSDPIYDYQCYNCGSEFESKNSRIPDVSCPDCASTEIDRA